MEVMSDTRPPAFQLFYSVCSVTPLSLASHHLIAADVWHNHTSPSSGVISGYELHTRYQQSRVGIAKGLRVRFTGANAPLVIFSQLHLISANAEQYALHVTLAGSQPLVESIHCINQSDHSALSTKMDYPLTEIRGGILMFILFKRGVECIPRNEMMASRRVSDRAGSCLATRVLPTLPTSANSRLVT
ncbi:BQ5605_C035g11427 [Microbotryum silenes-dioicae]|uniref:BQ5605_C035g11427 protein n=1 Tax=Microbotryum silenes-dioicae TaxID=796604 RepID=A0A2X0PAU2_9BASI|nr:BQ5605_C035g11427 [Microbotryum silenes-dioicae]